MPDNEEYFSTEIGDKKGRCEHGSSLVEGQNETKYRQCHPSHIELCLLLPLDLLKLIILYPNDIGCLLLILKKHLAVNYLLSLLGRRGVAISIVLSPAGIVTDVMLYGGFFYIRQVPITGQKQTCM